MTCNLDYIPSYLHSNDKIIVDEFYVGEQLYYRCKEGECKKPYDKISLYDISHNRNFGRPNDYPINDVLLNIDESDSIEKYENCQIATLVITQLNGQTTYIKTITSQQNPDLISEIRLKHFPVACMYPHSVFEISVNGQTINSGNYKQLLGKSNVTYKNLRSDIRQELTSIIQTKNIDPSKDIEYIEEP